VKHPECKGKIGPYVKSEGIRPTEMNSYSLVNGGPLCTLLKGTEHFGLDVNGNDPSHRADHSGERDGEIPHPWPDVQNSDAFSDVGSKDLIRVLKESS
jgi:hypothetical protein